MANNLTSSQWFLDTPSTTPVWKTLVKVRHIEFFDYAVDADKCVLTDQTGLPVWTGNGNTALETERSGTIGWVNGLILSTLSAGKVLVYTD